jgi:two-component system, NarL family, nitrate/nitrite response regulator NarL
MLMLRHSALILGPSQLLREALKLGLRRSPFVVVGEGRDFSEARDQDAFADVPDIVIAVGTSNGSLDLVLEEIHKASLPYPDVKYAIIADQFTSNDVLRALQAGVDAVLSMDASFSTILSSLKLVMIGQKIFPTLPMHLLAFERESAEGDNRPILLDTPGAQPKPPAPAASYRVPFVHRREVSQMAVARMEVVPSHLPSNPVIPGGGKVQVGAIMLSDREEQILRCLVNGQPNKVIARELGIAETTVKVHVKSVLRKAQASNRTQAAMWAVNQRFMQPGQRTRPALVNGLLDESHTG